MNALAAIHVAKKQLGLDEDDYRALLERLTGKRSARELSSIEAAAVLDEFRRLGVSPVTRSSAHRATGPFAGKLQALWIAAWNLGVVRSRDDRAMLAFIERQTGLQHTQFLRDAGDARKAIEALKAWLTREADVDWAPVPAISRGRVPGYYDDPRYRIVLAQVRALAVRDPSPIDVSAIAGRPFEAFSSADWIALMNKLGGLIRGAQKRRRKAA